MCSTNIIIMVVDGFFRSLACYHLALIAIPVLSVQTAVSALMVLLQAGKQIIHRDNE